VPSKKIHYLSACLSASATFHSASLHAVVLTPFLSSHFSSF
jgi:hypothetical protein